MRVIFPNYNLRKISFLPIEKIVKNTDLIKAELNNYAELDDDQISTHSINNDASGLEIADEVLNRVLKNHASS